MVIESILAEAISKKASDIHLTSQRPVCMRVEGAIVTTGTQALTDEEIFNLAKEITTPAQREQIEKTGGIDFGFSFKDRARFRVSCFKQKGGYALVLRMLPQHFFSFEELGLPPQLKELL